MMPPRNALKNDQLSQKKKRCLFIYHKKQLKNKKNMPKNVKGLKK
jgi:hypothetical protein